MIGSMQKRLWLGAAGVALFIATVFCGRAFSLPPSDRHGIEVDFIAFYTAGTFVREGRASQLYDLTAVTQFQRELATGLGEDLNGTYGPWWNPPFYALCFVPLSRMPYPMALKAWLGINLICAGGAWWLLCRMLPDGTSPKSWGLVPVLLALSMPFIYAISHAQNTCTSLLLLAGTVSLWRAHKPLLAGLLSGLMFYKPQLAVIPAIVLVLDQGWRAAIGLAVTGMILVLINIAALPGTLTDYLHRLPANVHLLQTHSAYPWERHITVKAFWRLLWQGNGPGEMSSGANALAAASSLSVAGWLIISWRASRAGSTSFPSGDRRLTRDRLISAMIVATPLLMPFYFDYDLLLLAIPAVLLAAERMNREITGTDRWLVPAWVVLYLWLMVNPDVAEKTRLNLAVLLLASVCALMIRRINAWPALRSCIQQPELLRTVA